MERCLLLEEVVDVTGDQKGDFKNLKREKLFCQAPVTVSPLSTGNFSPICSAYHHARIVRAAVRNLWVATPFAGHIACASGTTIP